MLKKILNIIFNGVGVILLIIIISILLMPNSVKRAINSGGPRIDDYSFFEQRIIQNGQPQPWSIAKNYNQYRFDQTIIDTFTQYGTVAFLVIQNSEICFEQYWDGYNEQKKVNPFSVSKGIVGLAIGAAIDDGYIKNVDQPVSDFLPEFKNNHRQRVTIKNLLTMSSGLGVTGSRKDMLFLAANAYYGNNLEEMNQRLEVTDTAGKRFSYQNHNTAVLAAVIKKATGKNLADYVSEKFWQPMGAEEPASWSLDHKDGMEKAYCCFNTTARDIARWGQLILNSGTWNGDTLISSSFIHRAIEPDTFLVDNENQPVDFYGYHFWIMQYQGISIPYLRGIAGQYLFVIPDKKAIVVRFGNKHHRERRGHHPADTYFFLDQAFKIIDFSTNK